MRSLIIRFADYEGPGVLEGILRNKGISITYHDTYKPGLKLLDNSHLVFDLIILMGGPQSVYDPSLKYLFEPIKKLVINSLDNPNSKLIGICLGSQIIAEALGSKVFSGNSGEEVGFGTCNIINKNHPILKGIDGDSLEVFHLHGDTFEIPETCDHILSSEKYNSQMFVFKNKIFGIQCHFEINENLLNVWKDKLPSVRSAFPKTKEELKSRVEAVNKSAYIIFENILNI